MKRLALSTIALASLITVNATAMPSIRDTRDFILQNFPDAANASCASKSIMKILDGPRTNYVIRTQDGLVNTSLSTKVRADCVTRQCISVNYESRYFLTPNVELATAAPTHTGASVNHYQALCDSMNKPLF